MKCRKRRYATEEEARRWTWKLAHAVYLCPACGHWHSTKAAQGPEDVARAAEALTVVERQRILKQASRDHRQMERRLGRSGRRKNRR